jgi:uncharacterized membrane protein YvbJ
MYLTITFAFIIVFTLVMIALYLAGKQENTMEKRLAGLILHIDNHEEAEVQHLKETVVHARLSLERFEGLNNLTEEEFSREENVLKELISELSLVKNDLKVAKVI